MAVYQLADRLGKTAGELMEMMSFDEFVHWVAFHRILDREINGK